MARAGWALAAIASLVVLSLLVPLAGAATGEIEVVGRVVVEHGDDFTGGPPVEYKVVEAGRDRYTVEGARAAELREGQQVRLRGLRRGGTLLLGPGARIETQAVAAAEGEGMAADTSATTTASAISKRVAVLLVNFAAPTPPPTPTPSPVPTASPVPSASPSPAASNDPSATAQPSASASPSEPTPSPSPSQSPTPSPSPTPTPTPPATPWTADEVRGIYFTNPRSAASYFGEVSNGRISVSGDVFGWYTLTVSTATCDYNGWASGARAAAGAAGVNLSSFTNFAYAFPRVDACPWGGLGSVNGPHSWINGKPKMNLYVAVHELGHNFGTHHAATVRCTGPGGVRVAYSANCTTNEYGDPFDVMGGNGSYASVFHLNNWARRLIGAVTTADQQTVTLNGNYTVAAAPVAGGSPRILRVARPSGDYFYLEYRRPFGVFDAWSSAAPVVNGVGIRLAPGTQRVPARLIDTTPETATFDDAVLSVGRTFHDPISGISITTLSIGASTAKVRIQVGPDIVAPTSPGWLSATASASDAITLAWSAASDDLEVAGYLVRRDGLPIGSPAGRSFTDAGLAQAATYTYSVSAYDGAGNLSPPVSMSFYLPDTTPPSVPPELLGAQTGYRRVSLGWSAATDNIGVVGYRVLRNGVLIAQTTDLALADDTVIDGWSYSYRVRAIDAAGNVGPPVTFGVSLPDVTAPSAPGATATAAPGPLAQISWTAASDNVAVAGYTVARGGTLLATLHPATTAFTEGGLLEGVYTYEVTAFDGAGNVGPVLAASATVRLRDVTPPSVPAGLTARSLNRRYIRLTWQASTDDRAGTIRYALFRGATRIARLTGTAYTDRPPYLGSYSYKVRAVDAAGNRSAFSPTVIGKAVRRV